MRQHLRHSPPGVPEAAVRQPLRPHPAGTHARGIEPYLELDVDGACAALGLVIEVGERRRHVGGANPGNAKRRERLQRYDPRRDGGGEVLGEEGSERLVLPRLHVARRPVIEQTQSEQVALRLGKRHAAAETVAATDEHADLELVVEAARRGEVWLGRARRQHLPAGPGKVLPGHAHRGGAPVIGNRHPLVVGQQRVIGPEQLPDRRGVMDRGIEVGEVSDLCGEAVLGGGLRDKERSQSAL